MYGNSDSEGTCELLEIPSMHVTINILRVYIAMRIYIYELKGVQIANFEGDLFSRSVKHCSISVVNSYQCSCKQCYAIAVYATCYIVINPRGHWAS